jgi:hypothetical protein
MDELARARWEKRLRELRQKWIEAGSAWRRAGGYWPVDGTPPSQPELLVVARDARERFYAAAAECYPPDLPHLLSQLRQGDREAIEQVIAWLEADYFTRETGYIKHELMRRLCQIALTEADKERLRGVVLVVCTRGPRMEFRELKKLARRQLADAEFAARLRELAASSDDERTAWAATEVMAAVETQL